MRIKTNRTLLSCDDLRIRAVPSTPDQMAVSPTKEGTVLNPAEEQILFKFSR